MVPTHDAVVVLCTAPDEEVADALARALVESRLAACVACTPGVRSTYVWDGELTVETEVQLVIKTHRDRIDAIGRLVAEKHPYDVPELLAIPACAGSDAYLRFIDEATRPRSE